MRRFHLVTEWSFDAPIEHVWELLNEPERFPEWWPGFDEAEITEGDGEIGSVARYKVSGDFGFVFYFATRVEEKREPEYIRVSAAGDLAGTGEWFLQQRDGGTDVTYIWDVDVRRPIVRWLSYVPGARAAMKRSHDGVMEEGGENLARLLAEYV